MKYEAEDGSYSPCNACRTDDPGGFLERLGVKDATVHEQDGDFDHEDGKGVSDKGSTDGLAIWSARPSKS